MSMFMNVCSKDEAHFLEPSFFDELDEDGKVVFQPNLEAYLRMGGRPGAV